MTGAHRHYELSPSDRRSESAVGQDIGRAQAEADRAEIRRLIAMADWEREAYFLESNRNVLQMLADAAVEMTGPTAEAFDPLGMIRVLNEQAVRYVVIGGIAAGVQGAIWASADLDIAYARDRDNYERLAAALAELQAVPIDLPAGVRVTLDARHLASGTNWTLRTRLGRLDLLGKPGAGLDYEALVLRARLIQGQQTYSVASIDDLIALKCATGRPKEVGHVELLRVTAEELAMRKHGF